MKRAVGFYFDAACHTPASFKTWPGKLPLMKSSGLGLIIIHVGLQQDGCGQANLSRAKGLQHGLDTIDKFTAEGFPKVFVTSSTQQHPLTIPE